MTEQVFLAENLSLCHHFLSLQRPAAFRRVIATDLPANKGFFGELMGVNRLDLLPQMMAWIADPKAPPPAHWWGWLEQLHDMAARLDALVADIPTSTSVHWLHAMGPLNLFAVLGRLLARGNPVRFPSSSLITDLYRLTFHRDAADFTGMHPDMVRFIDKASAVTGCRLSMVQVQPHDGSWSYFGIGPHQTEPPEAIALTPWPHLSAALHSRLAGYLQLPEWQEAAPLVLLIDDKIGEEHGMHARQSLEAVNAYLSQRLDTGARIYVKPHYHGSSRANNFLDARLNTLSCHLPAELLLGLFDEVCFFKSSTMATPTHAKRTCLLPLIHFADEKTRDFYWQLLRSYVGDCWDEVTFICQEQGRFFHHPVSREGTPPPWCG